MSQSQRSRGQSQRQTQSQSSSQIQQVQLKQEHVIKFIKYVLNNAPTKIPIKRTDLVTNVLDGNTKLFQSCFEQAQELLLETYGSKLVQVPNKTPIQYICVSMLEPVSELEYTADQRKHTTLLFLVLSLIFMKGGSTNEKTIIEFLKGLGIYWEEPHAFLGNVKKLLTETYLKQQYLVREKHVIEGNQEEEYAAFAFGNHTLSNR